MSPALPTYSILVTGPESCGNHLATTICQRLTGLPVASHKLIDTEQLVAQGPTIVLRSLPHGGAGSDIGRRCYLPWELLHAHLHAGRDLKLVLALRDRTISTASKLATGHSANHDAAVAEQQEAAAILRRTLTMFPDRCFVFSYESLLWLGDPYVATLASFLGVPWQRGLPLQGLELIDGNPKYLAAGKPEKPRPSGRGGIGRHA